uniref:Uncharacterized protein n=1 Tax=Anguilla anguilla TaxID=7936 RepID=A0A0E9U8A6_ANGAN
MCHCKIQAKFCINVDGPFVYIAAFPCRL